MSLEAFRTALAEGVDRLRQAGGLVTIVHHNDADGLASAVAVQTALERAGFKTRTIPLERVHPPIIERLHNRSDGPVLYVDLGGQAAAVIAAANRGRQLTLILDHHHPTPVSDPTVLNLSTEFFDLSGDMDISAATGAYFFALALNPANRDLAYLGVIGAVGDRHNRAGKLVGQNRLALEQAVALGDVHLEENNGQEQYWLTRFGDPLPLDTFWRSVTTLGAAGYYMGGPALGMQMCLAGPSPEVERKLAELSRLKETAFSRTLDRLRQNGLWQTHHCQWFVVERDFEPMGVKMIGQFCEDIADEPFIDPHKYIVGFQIMPPETPGLGRFDWELYKVSMRVPAVLEHQILVEQSMPGLAAIVPPAAEAVGGSIDACHNYAAATVIDVDRATDLLAEMDRLVEVFKA